MQSLRRIAPSLLIILLLLTSTPQLQAQGAEGQGNIYVIAMLVIIGALILVSAIVVLSENFVHLEAKKAGVAEEGQNQSLLSSVQGLWQSSGPEYTGESTVIHLSKGHDILLNGDAGQGVIPSEVKRYAAKPTDYRGMSPIPKVLVAPGDEVKAGDQLFFDKKDPTIKYVAPVSGEVLEVRRGPKRAITEVIILGDKEVKFRQMDPPSISEGSIEEIQNFLYESGGWALINERPFDQVPAPGTVPQNVFISTFDSAPLAPDLNFIVEGKAELFQKGIDTLARLTEGQVHLGLDARGDHAPSAAFVNATNCAKHWFKGKHPSGNVGIQIHHVAPINAGDKVWTLNVQQVITLGELMYKGIYNAERVVAVTGAQVKHPGYVKTYVGASLDDILAGNLSEKKSRVIDGDVLSGKMVEEDSFLSQSSDQITVIEEGDYHEMFGWLLPIKPRPTISKTFPNFLYPNLKFDGDTNMHGERRAFVLSGQYEQVLPMKIFPQHLMKAIMSGEFEQMEGLGIYELSEEDLALCEFTCTSKMPLQSILRDGLDMIQEQS